MNRKRDANEVEIVQHLETFGATVWRIESRFKPGCPDLLVIYRGKIFALEVKTLDGTLTKEQAMQTAVPIVRTSTQALHAIGINI